MKKDEFVDDLDDKNYPIYDLSLTKLLIIGSIIMFLFLLVPISLNYFNNSHFIIYFIIFIIGCIILINFSARLIKTFNSSTGKVIDEINERESTEKHNQISFKNHLDDYCNFDEHGEYLYNLNDVDLYNKYKK